MDTAVMVVMVDTMEVTDIMDTMALERMDTEVMDMAVIMDIVEEQATMGDIMDTTVDIMDTMHNQDIKGMEVTMGVTEEKDTILTVMNRVTITMLDTRKVMGMEIMENMEVIRDIMKIMAMTIIMMMASSTATMDTMGMTTMRDTMKSLDMEVTSR